MICKYLIIFYYIPVLFISVEGELSNEIIQRSIYNAITWSMLTITLPEEF